MKLDVILKMHNFVLVPRDFMGLTNSRDLYPQFQECHNEPPPPHHHHHPPTHPSVNDALDGMGNLWLSRHFEDHLWLSEECCNCRCSTQASAGVGGDCSVSTVVLELCHWPRSPPPAPPRMTFLPLRLSFNVSCCILMANPRCKCPWERKCSFTLPLPVSAS